MIKFEIPDKLYGARVTILVCGHEEAYKFFKTKYKLEYTGLQFCNGLAPTIEDKKNGISYNFIWLDKFEYTPKWISILVHECLHLTFEILKDRQLFYSKETEEAYCYYHDYLVKEALDRLLKHSVKAKTLSNHGR